MNTPYKAAYQTLLTIYDKHRRKYRGNSSTNNWENVFAQIFWMPSA